MTVTAILWNLFSALAVIILVAMLKDIHITLLTYCSSWDVLHSLRVLGMIALVFVGQC